MEQIDVLMATYNGEKYLKEQIDSILDQTYSNIRLIISDDCSTDGTRDLLKEYEKKNEKIKVYYQEENLGYVKNFEFLLKKVENEIYMLSDQDDVWLPTKIEHTYKKLKETNADLVFTDLEIVDENLNTLYESFNDYMKLSRKIKKYKSDYRLQYLYNCVTGCTLMSTKKFINIIVPIPTDSKYVIHDTWIACVVANKGKVEYLDEKTIKYRQHGKNQVGVEKISHGFKNLEQVRNLFLDVKLGVFNTYVNNDDIFNEKLKEQNIEALEYYKMVAQKKNFNFKKWDIFHKLYKNETVNYYIINFVIMNLPAIGRVLFKIRYMIVKLRKNFKWRKLT